MKPWSIIFTRPLFRLRLGWAVCEFLQMDNIWWLALTMDTCIWLIWPTRTAFTSTRSLLTKAPSLLWCTATSESKVENLENFHQIGTFLEYPQLLASSGIDHFVHIFRRSSSYQPIYVLSEHHSPVTSCLFAEGSANAYLYTSGLDRLMIQWRIDNDAVSHNHFYYPEICVKFCWNSKN